MHPRKSWKGPDPRWPPSQTPSLRPEGPSQPSSGLFPSLRQAVWRNLMDSRASPGSRASASASPGWQGRAGPTAEAGGGAARGACGRAGGGGARAGAPAWPAPPRSRSAGGRRQRSGPSVRRSVGLPGPALPPGAARLHGPRRRRREVARGPRGPLTGRWGRAMGDGAVRSCRSRYPYPSWSGAPC